MKNLTSILILILLTQFVDAQEDSFLKNSWRSEYGRAYTGRGDIGGFAIYNEYARIVNRNFKIAPAFGYASFDNIDNDNAEQLLQTGNYRSLELTGYFTPHISDFVVIELGLGGFYKNWGWVYATGNSLGLVVGDLDLDASEHGTVSENTFGYTVSVGFIFKLTNNLGVNTRGVLQNDLAGNITTGARLGFNIAF